MTICTINIEDEVNIKVSGLDATLRRKLEKKFKFFQQSARHTPAYKLGRWDGCIGFFSIGGRTYLNLLDQILPEVIDAGYTVEVNDNRIQHQFTFPEVTEDFHGSKVWPPGHTHAGKAITLRDYQIGAITEFTQNLQSIGCISTGAGKTILVATLSALVEPFGRTVVIVPNKDLVKQTYDDYLNLGLDVGVYFGDKKELNKTHTICTWQSLNIIDKKFKAGESEIGLAEFSQDMAAVIVDECFDGDTLILTPNGRVPIRDVKAGDKVINYSETNSRFKTDTVVKQHINLENSDGEKMYELEFDIGRKIKVTGNHKFLTTQGWIRADQLSNEHEVIEFAPNNTNDQWDPIFSGKSTNQIGNLTIDVPVLVSNTKL